MLSRQPVSMSTPRMGRGRLLYQAIFATSAKPLYFDSPSHVQAPFALLLTHGARLAIADASGCDTLQQAIEWNLGNSNPSKCLSKLLRLASDLPVSEARIQVAIHSCRKNLVPEPYNRQGLHVANVLLDFQQRTWEPISLELDILSGRSRFRLVHLLYIERSSAMELGGNDSHV